MASLIAVSKAIDQLKMSASVELITAWDCAPMHTLLRFEGTADSERGATVIDWESHGHD